MMETTTITVRYADGSEHEYDITERSFGELLKRYDQSTQYRAFARLTRELRTGGTATLYLNLDHVAHITWKE